MGGKKKTRKKKEKTWRTNHGGFSQKTKRRMGKIYPEALLDEKMGKQERGKRRKENELQNPINRGIRGACSEKVFESKKEQTKG